MEKRFFTVNEVAEMTGFQPRTIREMVASGRMNGVKFGGEYRITSEEIEDYIKRNSTRRDHKIDTSGDNPNR